MAGKATDYKCPGCTGPLVFVGESGRVECDYCGSSYDVSEIEALYSDSDKVAAEIEDDGWNIEGAGSEWGEEGDSLKAYICPSCGAEIICDETTGSTSCVYCGNSTIVPGQFSGTLKPDYVIPFSLTKEDAKTALKDHYKGKFLLPKSFSNSNHIEELKGVYVPFWLFDGKVDVKLAIDATKIKSYRDGDYIVTETEHYDVYRSGNVSFEKVPVDGSLKMPDEYMDSIEPFNYESLTEFTTAYLPGFLADKYDVDSAEAGKRADKRCIRTAESEILNTVNDYDDINVVSRNIKLYRGDVKYALLPVWMLTTKWNNVNYIFAMNGQTGKLVGDLPADKKKVKYLFWGVALGSSAILSAFLSGPLGNLIAGFIG